jgi:hypothetical protein
VTSSNPATHCAGHPCTAPHSSVPLGTRPPLPCQVAAPQFVQRRCACAGHRGLRVESQRDTRPPPLSTPTDSQGARSAAAVRYCLAAAQAPQRRQMTQMAQSVAHGCRSARVGSAAPLKHCQSSLKHPSEARCMRPAHVCAGEVCRWPPKAWPC